MQKYNWNYPTTMWVGENRINDIAQACKTLNISKPLLVTDKGLADTEIVKKYPFNFKKSQCCCSAIFKCSRQSNRN